MGIDGFGIFDRLRLVRALRARVMTVLYNSCLRTASNIVYV